MDRIKQMKGVRMRWLLVLITLFGFTLVGADVNGTWKGKAETPNGTTERTLVFKVDGNKLTARLE